MPSADIATVNLNQVTLPATDLVASNRFYRAMGFTQIVQSDHYSRFECDNGATFSLHQVDQPVADHGVVVYFETGQLDTVHAELVRQGFEFLSAPSDQRWGWREARLRDPDGNQICLFHAGQNRRHPPWRVELRDENTKPYGARPQASATP